MSMPMRPHSYASRILRLLADGPARTADIAAELEHPIAHTTALLQDLVNRGKVVKQPYPTGNRTRRNLWLLPQHVEEMA